MGGLFGLAAKGARGAKAAGGEGALTFFREIIDRWLIIAYYSYVHMHIIRGEVMPRPKKCRRIGFVLQNECFAPCGMEGGGKGQVIMTIEEVEAIRLADLERLDQNACAEQMGISRGTFQRIVASARQKVADALVNARTIRIESDLFVGDERTFVCRQCGHTWRDSCSGKTSERCDVCACTELAYATEYPCCAENLIKCANRKEFE